MQSDLIPKLWHKELVKTCKEDREAEKRVLEACKSKKPKPPKK